MDTKITIDADTASRIIKSQQAEIEKLKARVTELMQTQMTADEAARLNGILRVHQCRLIYFGTKSQRELLTEVGNHPDYGRKLAAYLQACEINDINYSPLTAEQREMVRKSFGDRGQEYWHSHVDAKYFE